MGTDQFTPCMRKSIELDIEHMLHILQVLKKQNNHSSLQSDTNGTPVAASATSTFTNASAIQSDINAECVYPSVSIDANNIAFKSLVDPINFVLDVTKSLATAGITVNVVADNRNCRHDSKRKSHQRIAIIEKARLDHSQLSNEMQSQLQAGADCTNLSKLLQKSENAKNRKLPIEFHDDLSRALKDLRMDTAHFKEAEMQADPVLAYHYRQHLAQMIISNDSDLFAHSPDAILMHKFKRSKKDGKISGIILATAKKESSELISNILRDRFSSFQNNKPIFSAPEFPLFDNEIDATNRSLIACAIGNDHWIKGQEGFGPSAAMKVLQDAKTIHDAAQRRNFIASQILNHKGDKTKMKCKDTLFAFSSALLYEPANEVKQPRAYAHSPPTFLPNYLSDFAPNAGCTIIESLEVMTCAFLGNGTTHTFLSAEGHHACSDCSQTICRYCATKENKSADKLVCIGCRAAMSGGLNESVDMETMRKKIIEVGVSVPSTASYLNIKDLHDKIVEDEEMNLHWKELQQVELPKHGVKGYKSPLFIEKVSDNVMNFARVFNSSAISNIQARELLHFCAELVTFQTTDDTVGKRYKVHDVMPQMMIDFCNRSRAHSGLRLMKRACRHSTYVEEPDIKDAIFTVGAHDDEGLCIHMKKEVAASFHKKSTCETYWTEMACNVKDLLFTKCQECAAGAKDGLKCSVTGPNSNDKKKIGDRHVCAHNMVPLHSLMKEMFCGLAEQILIEFHIRMQASGIDIIDDKELRDDIVALSYAAKVTHEVGSNASAMLSKFAVGTDRAKRYPGSPKAESMRPLRECKNMSPVRTMNEIITSKPCSSSVTSTAQPSTTQPFPTQQSSTHQSTSTQSLLPQPTITQPSATIASAQSQSSTSTSTHKTSTPPAPSAFDLENANTYLACEAINLHISKQHPKLKGNNKRNQIRFRLQKFRAEKTMDAMTDESFDRHSKVLECEARFENALNYCATRRHPSASVHKYENNNTLETKNKENGSKISARTEERRCQMVGCGVLRAERCMTCVPREPKKPPADASERRWTTYCKKKFARRESLDRLGLTRNCKLKDARYCRDHPTEKKKFSVEVKWGKKDDENNAQCEDDDENAEDVAPPSTSCQSASASSQSTISPSSTTPSSTTPLRRSLRKRRKKSNVTFQPSTSSAHLKVATTITPSRSLRKRKQSRVKSQPSTSSANMKVATTITPSRSLRKRKHKKKNKKTVSIDLNVPKPLGKSNDCNNTKKTPNKRPQRGIGYDRQKVNEIEYAKKEDREVCGCMRMAEANDMCESPDAVMMINPVAAQSCGADHHMRVAAAQSMDSKAEKRKLIVSQTPKKKKMKSETAHHCKGEDPKFKLEELDPSEVKRLTGFNDLSSMLSFATFTCGGDFEVIAKTTSKLTWLEEWLLHCAWSYGRVSIRQKDIMKMFGMKRKPAMRDILKKKQKLVLDCRTRHPFYATLEEDEALRKEHWNKMLRRNGGERRRIIMHDMSNFPLENPENAELNRALFNQYYSGCCGKGGMFTQMCGWEGTHDLFTGAIGDSEHVRKALILETQEKFQNEDLTIDGNAVEFINIFDKGYRVILDCLKLSQLCWQPAFARSDEKHGTYSTLLTGAVAFTRSGNERSVKHLKHSWRIVKGGVGMPNIDLDMMSDLWLGWGFQMNFMHEPVH